MNVLMLTHHIPHPLTDGGRIRDFNVLRRMAASNQVTLCCFTSEPRMSEAVEAIEALGVSVVGVSRQRRIAVDLGWSLLARKPYHTVADGRQSMHDAVSSAAMAGPIDVVYCSFLLSMAQYLPEVPRTAIRVLDQHNLDHVVWNRAAHADPSMFRRLVSRAVASSVTRYERQHLGDFDLIFSVSDSDLEGTSRLIDSETLARLAPNGVDLDYFAAAGDPPENNQDVVFVASMDMRMNSDAVAWFVREIWPTVRAEIPLSRFCVVGRGPSAEVLGLHNGLDLNVTGTVPDVRGYLKQASVVVVPSRLGGGTKLKVLEAMAAARPIVATSVGVQGIDAIDGRDLLVADSPSAYADAVVRVLRDRALARSLGANARAAVEANYGWDAIWSRMELEIRGVLDARHARGSP